MAQPDIFKGEAITLTADDLAPPSTSPVTEPTPSPYLPPEQTTTPTEALMAQPTETAGQYMQDVYGLAADDVAKSFAYFGAMHGSTTYDQVNNDFDKNRLSVLQKQRVSAYRANVPSDTQSQIGLWGANLALEAAPSLNAGFQGGVVGALAGGAMGVLAGPPGIIAGAAEGFMAGSAALGGVVAAGQTYGVLRDHGLDHDQAKVWATGTGVLEALIMSGRVKGMVSAFGKSKDLAAKAPTLFPYKPATLVQFASNFLHASGHAGALGAAQSIAGSMMEYSALAANQKSLPSLTDSVNLAKDAALKNAALGGAFQVSGHAFGTVFGKLVDAHKGNTIAPETSIDLAASQANVDNLVNEARSRQALLSFVKKNVEGLQKEGKPVPPAMMNAYIEAQAELERAEAKAVKAAEAHAAKADFESLDLDDRKKAADVQYKMAKTHLTAIQEEIETSADPDNPPQDLKDLRKEARISLRVASERKKAVALEIERDELKSKITSNAATPAAVRQAQEVAKRAEQIDKELKEIRTAGVRRDIEKQKGNVQQDLEKVNEKIASKTNPPTYLQRDAEKLQGQIDSLQTLGELLDSGYASDSDLKAIASMNRIDSLVHFTKILLNKTAKDFAKNARHDIQKEFGMVQRVIRFSGLTKSEASTLKQFKPGDDLAAYLDYLDGKIESIVHKREMGEARENLTKALKKTQPTEVNKELKGLMTVQSVLTLYNRLIKTAEDSEESKAEKDAAIETILTKEVDVDQPTAEGGVHPLTQKLIALEIKEAVTPEAINALAKHIQEIAKEGLDEKLEREQNKADQLKKVTDLFASVFPESQPDKKTFDNANWMVKLGRLGTDLVLGNTEIMPWNHIVEFVIRFADEKTKYQVRKLLNVRKAVDGTAASITETTDAMLDFLTNGDKKLKGELIKAQGKPGKPRKGAELVTPDADSAQQLANATGDQLMRLYGAMLEATSTREPKPGQTDLNTMRSRLIHGNKFTLYGDKSTMAWVKKQLSPGQRKMVERASKFYSTSLYERANKVHLRVNGYPLEYNPNYSGPAQAILEDTTTNDFLKALEDGRGTTPGFIKRRVNNVSALPLDVGMLSNLEGYIRQLSHFENFTEDRQNMPSIGETLAAIAKNPKIKQRMVNTFGERVYKVFKIAAEDISGIKPVKVEQLKIIGKLVKGVGSVVHSPAQLVKQFTGVLMYLKYENVLDLAKGVDKVLTNFEHYEKLFSEMEFIKAREAGKSKTLKARVENAKGAGGDNPVKNFILGLQWLQSLPLEYADKANILLGGGALYALEHDRMIAAGFSEAQAHAEAEAYMAKASVETQGSSLVDQRLPMERNALGAALAQFTRPATQAHFAAATDVRELLADPSLKNLHKAVASSVAVRAAEMAFVAASAAPALISALMLADKDKEAAKKFDRVAKDFLISETLALTIGPASGLPTITNSVANALYKAVLYSATGGQAHEYETQLAVLEMATSGYVFGSEFIQVGSGHKQLSEEELFAILRAGNRSVLMGTTGLNADPYLGSLHFLLDYLEDPIDRKIRKQADRNESRQRKKERESNDTLSSLFN